MKELSATVPQHLMGPDRPDTIKAKNTLGKDDFLKLLMAQLNNQDPLKPMEHQEFSAQLAQFGSLEQLQNIHKGIENLSSGMGNEAKLSALSMIGKQVQASGNEVELLEGQSVVLKYGQKEGVTPVQAIIYNAGGKIVREVALSAKDSETEVSWDGKDTEGNSLPSGKYAFRIQGVDKTGQSQELGSELKGKVTAVEMEGANPVLLVQTPGGTTRMDLGKIRQVGMETPTSEAAGKKAEGATTVTPKPTVAVQPTEKNDGKKPSGNVEEVEDMPWRGFPAFASFEDLKP